MTCVCVLIVVLPWQLYNCVKGVVQYDHEHDPNTFPGGSSGASPPGSDRVMSHMRAPIQNPKAVYCDLGVLSLGWPW